MADRKKPEAPGPVVIRKGVLEPAPPRPPEEPRREPEGERKDARPLWQRVAESKGAAAPGGRGAPRPGAGRARPWGGARPGGSAIPMGGARPRAGERFGR